MVEIDISSQMMIFIESRLGYGLSENESDRCSYEQYLSSSEYRA